MFLGTSVVLGFRVSLDNSWSTIGSFLLEVYVFLGSLCFDFGNCVSVMKTGPGRNQNG